MHLVTVEPQPPAALFDLIAEHGTTTSANGAHVTITLAGVAYTFSVYLIGGGEDPGRLEVHLEHYTLDVPPLLFEEIQVRDPHRRPIAVGADAAKRIANRQRRFGRCQPCQHDRHTSCTHPDPEDYRCWCACGDEWASGRMAEAMAFAVTLDSGEAPQAG